MFPNSGEIRIPKLNFLPFLQLRAQINTFVGPNKARHACQSFPMSFDKKWEFHRVETKIFRRGDSKIALIHVKRRLIINGLNMKPIAFGRAHPFSYRNPAQIAMARDFQSPTAQCNHDNRRNRNTKTRKDKRKDKNEKTNATSNKWYARSNLMYSL